MRCLKRWYNNDIDNIGEPDRFVTRHPNNPSLLECLTLIVGVLASSGTAVSGLKQPPLLVDYGRCAHPKGASEFLSSFIILSKSLTSSPDRSLTSLGHVWI